MVKLNNNNQIQTNQTEDGGFETNNLNKTNSASKKEESGLIKTLGQLLPLAPFVFEQFTGQKVPQMTGTIAEIQMALINIQTNLQTIVNSQNQLTNRFQQLETSASQQLNNLTHQFNSLRLTHTKERKEIAYNNPPLEESENQDY